MPVSQNFGTRIIPFQLPEQVEQRALLRVCTGIGGHTILIEPALITDADALVVPTGGMSANLMDGAANMHFAIAGDVKMISDAGKAPCQMTAAKCFHGEVTVATRSTAMNYQEVHLPVVLIETACFHCP